MKNFIFIIILLSFGAVHAQTNEVELLKQANQNLVSAYQNKKFDEALKFAQSALDLSLKIYGTENDETAVAYSNLGSVYRVKQKYKEASENFQKVVEIYQKKPDKNGKELIKIYQDLADVLLNNQKLPEAEENYLKAIELTEQLFGKESKETLNAVFLMAQKYIWIQKTEESYKFFLRSYELAIKNFGKESKEIEKIDYEIICSRIGELPKSKQKKFNEEKLRLFDSESDSIQWGKTMFLEKPNYYPVTGGYKEIGRIGVRILIDESGNVIQANALCGLPLLQKKSEEAALKSKYSPTLKNGKPIKVNAFIIYDFLMNGTLKINERK